MTEKQGKSVQWERDHLLETAEKGQDMNNPEKGIALTFLAHTDNASVNVVELKKALLPHAHMEHDEVIVVMEGSGEAVVDGEIRQFGPGDIFFCPKGTYHGFNSRVKLFSVYMPFFDTDNPDRVFEG